jgi:hypothetical protein
LDELRDAAYGLFEPGHIERIAGFVERALPGHETIDHVRATYAARQYLGPLSPEDIRNMTVVSTPGVSSLSPQEQAEAYTRAIAMSCDPKPEPSMLVLDPAAAGKRMEDGNRTVILPFLTGSTKVWIKKDDFGDPDDPESVPPEYRGGVAGRYVVTCLLPDEY